ncbi:MAG TPA: hypothetical protein VHT52_17805 [Stellaceae bacterium]|jgi:hypothetical protein|nr:hypothetical protein [Stellaceae bacterium]
MIRFISIAQPRDFDDIVTTREQPVLVNPDHITIITPHEKNPAWCSVEIIDDYTLTVVGTIDEIEGQFDAKYPIRR